MSIAESLLLSLEQAAERLPARQVDGDYPDAAVAVAVVDGLEPSLLLTRRAATMRIHAGECAFPGGKQDPEDENLLATALREMQEEVAVAPELFVPVAEMPQLLSRSKIRVTPHLGVLPADVRYSVNTGELDAVFAPPLAHLMGEGLSYYEDADWRLPVFTWQEFRVWGITAVMIADLLNALYGADINYKRGSVK